MYSIVTITVQILRIWEQQEKNGKRQPERLQKGGKVAASLRTVSPIVAALLTPFFTSKNHTLNFFSEKNIFL